MDRNANYKKQMTEIEVAMLHGLVSSMVEQRKSLGMSQRELAELCDMPQSSIGRIERFKTTPNLKTILRMMHYLGMTFSIDPKKSAKLSEEIELLREIEIGEKSGEEKGWIPHEEVLARFAKKGYGV